MLALECLQPIWHSAQCGPHAALVQPNYGGYTCLCCDAVLLHAASTGTFLLPRPSRSLVYLGQLLMGS